MPPVSYERNDEYATQPEMISVNARFCKQVVFAYA